MPEEEQKQQEQQEQQEQEAPEKPQKTSVLNPKLQIGSYAFEDGAKFESATPVALTDEEHAKYADEKHGGTQVVVRVKK